MGKEEEDGAERRRQLQLLWGFWGVRGFMMDQPQHQHLTSVGEPGCSWGLFNFPFKDLWDRPECLTESSLHKYNLVSIKDQDWNGV